MRISVNPAAVRCPKQGCYVSLEQTEGECRERHHCSDEACPLAEQLGQNNFARILNVVADDIRDGFAKSLGGK